MSVAQTAERVSKQAGNSVTTAFSGSWKIFAKTDLTVYKVSAAGAYTLGVVDVDYTVVFDTAAETWTVTYTVAPVTGGFAVILGDAMPVTQASAFPREGAMPAATGKNAFDKLTVLVQQLRDRVDRTIIQPLTPVNPNNQITVDTPVHRRGLVYEITGSDITIVPTEDDPDTALAAAQAAQAAAELAEAHAETAETNAETAETNAEASETAAAASAAAAAASASAMVGTSGLIAARPAGGATRLWYYATDEEQEYMWSPAAARWFLVG